jgi:hypothetical protein
MALDLSKIAPDGRKELIAAGEAFNSDTTLAQARKTLNALNKHRSKLIDYGFNEEDEEHLKDAADELVAAGVGRDDKRTEKKKTSKTYVDTLHAGQAVRLRSHSVLGSVRRVAVQIAGESHTAAVRAIDTVLEQGSVAAEEANALAAQLDRLRKVLDDDGTVEELSKSRGGPKAVKDLADAAGALRVAAQNAAGTRGTPEETERLDLIDGIILGLVRGAAKAAGYAAKALGEPSLDSAFALTELYDSSARSTAKQGEPATSGTEEKPPV